MGPGSKSFYRPGKPPSGCSGNRESNMGPGAYPAWGGAGKEGLENRSPPGLAGRQARASGPLQEAVWAAAGLEPPQGFGETSGLCAGSGLRGPCKGQGSPHSSDFCPPPIGLSHMSSPCGEINAHFAILTIFRAELSSVNYIHMLSSLHISPNL